MRRGSARRSGRPARARQPAAAGQHLRATGAAAMLRAEGASARPRGRCNDASEHSDRSALRTSMPPPSSLQMLCSWLKRVDGLSFMM